MASAGIAGLVVGAAAQPALKNLIAGVQMAFTEPIRIDDVLIVDGEWGRVEQINLTFVVIKIWDERRLVVPVSKFLEQSFQNWTRETSQLMGSVFWYLDPSADVPRLREKLGEIVTSNPRWDKRFYNLQVTDVKTDCIELRGLMTAKDAAIAFDLRCDVREALLKYIREEMPEAIPRNRLLMAPDLSTHFPRHPDESQDPEPNTIAVVTLGPDFRQDDGVGLGTVLSLDMLRHRLERSDEQLAPPHHVLLADVVDQLLPPRFPLGERASSARGRSRRTFPRGCTD